MNPRILIVPSDLAIAVETSAKVRRHAHFAHRLAVWHNRLAIKLLTHEFTDRTLQHYSLAVQHIAKSRVAGFIGALAGVGSATVWSRQYRSPVAFIAVPLMGYAGNIGARLYMKTRSKHVCNGSHLPPIEYIRSTDKVFVLPGNTA